ncbi:MAG: PQQ-binding-like beta-propeller repeat protein, partial [Candidatus Firestonebacteria bacterium]
SPSLYNNKIMLSSCDGMLRLIELGKGEVTEYFSVGSYVASSPAVFEGRYYIASLKGTASCWDLKTEKTLWTETLTEEEEIYASPAVTGEFAVFASRSKDVCCYDSLSGKLRWKFSAKDSIDSSPVISGNMVFFGSNDGNLYGLELKTGKMLWSYTAGGQITASPAIGNGKMVIGSSDGAVYCFGKKD